MIFLYHCIVCSMKVTPQLPVCKAGLTRGMVEGEGGHCHVKEYMLHCTVDSYLQGPKQVKDRNNCKKRSGVAS